MVKELLGAFFIRELILLMAASPYNDLPEASPSNTITSGVRISTYGFGGVEGGARCTNIWGDSTCCRATQLVCHTCQACVLRPLKTTGSRPREPQLMCSWAAAMKPAHPGASAPQQEKALQRAAHVPQLEISHHCPQLEKARVWPQKTQCS